MLLKSRIKLITVFIFLSVSLMLLDRSGKIDFLTYPARKVLIPLQLLYIGAQEKLVEPVHFVQFIRSGEERIKYLENKNLELFTQTSQVAVLKRENDDLRRQLGTDLSKTHSLAAIKILGVNRYLEFETNSTRVKRSHSVVYVNNLIGRVTKINSGIGFIQLLSDSESHIPVKTDTATGVLTGEFSTGLVLDKVNKTEILTAGQVVVTSGLDENMPQGLVVGKIDKILSSADSLFQRALVKPLIDGKTLKTAFVIVD